MNHVLSGAAAADFGMDSMFENSRQRQRQTLADEDAPPTNSVNDIVNELYEAGPRRPSTFSLDSPARSLMFRPAQSHTPATPKPSTSAPTAKPLHVVVFGYPPDKYSVTAEYFRSLGDSTEPDQNTEIMNCFRIGYTNPGEAMRAVRKNGEVLGGAWMIGVKWADPAQAEAALGSSLIRSPFPLSSPPDVSSPGPDISVSDSSPTRGFPSAETNMALSTVQRAQKRPLSARL
ncbi:hypothetical protein EW026_g215 [Hermanssonia centrifuga]|uniref:RRM Nup35-type domain-containing protein n=1 Tax=Hermanssonia centrifuga TaxID=98765 RepID=A0A4S4KZU3_9APHY|nr:hypothetical protein EW026_g215 [Hermanssonia centrifuga]